MTTMLERRSADQSAGSVGAFEAVVVRPVPGADPPYENATADEQPPAGMEMLPVPWTGVDKQRSASVDRAARPSSSATSARNGGVPNGRPRRLITAQHAARRYVDLCVEVLNGYRPAAQLRPFTEPRRFSAVADQLIRRTARVRMGTVSPRRPRPVQVKRMVVGEPIDGVAEAAAVLGRGDSVWAMAVRMERQGDGWLCTFAGVL